MIKVRLKDGISKVESAWGLSELDFIKPGIWYSAERSLTGRGRAAAPQTFNAVGRPKIALVMHEPKTFRSFFYYLITCDDGLCRKFDAHKFIELDDWRKDRLEDLGIA